MLSWTLNRAFTGNRTNHIPVTRPSKLKSSHSKFSLKRYLQRLAQVLHKIHQPLILPLRKPLSGLSIHSPENQRVSCTKDTDGIDMKGYSLTKHTMRLCALHTLSAIWASALRKASATISVFETFFGILPEPLTVTCNYFLNLCLMRSATSRRVSWFHPISHVGFGGQWWYCQLRVSPGIRGYQYISIWTLLCLNMKKQRSL